MRSLLPGVVVLCTTTLVLPQHSEETLSSQNPNKVSLSAKSQVPLVRLKNGEEHRLSARFRVSLPLRCDDKGEIFLDTASGEPQGSVIQKIARDGSLAASYSYVPEKLKKEASFYDFSVSPGGELSAVLKFSPDLPAEIVQFEDDGKVARSIPLQPEMRLAPRQLVSLAGGGFFVAGTVKAGGEPESKERAFAGIYDASGRLQREVLLKENARSLSDSGQRSSIDFSMAVAGIDGNVYLLRSDDPATMFVVSAGGQLLRKYVVVPPLEHAKPLIMLEGQGHLAILFHQEKGDLSNSRIRVIGPKDGAPIVDYAIDDFSEAVACYTGDEFTFYKPMPVPAIVTAGTR